jgi:hypothetical protein
LPSCQDDWFWRHPAPVAFYSVYETALLPVVAQHRTRGAAGLAAVELESKTAKFSLRVPTHSAALNAEINAGPTATGAGAYIGALPGMSAVRAALVSATIDTVASKNLFIGPTPVAC